ncbi:unnamed protein product, partial [Brassica oleracea var. botrytis]
CTVSVKWQKKVFEGIEIDPTLPPYVFKAQLYDLTGVPPERQKIMVKGGLLKDDADWSAIGVKDGQKLMMMGTADEIVKAPEKAIVFAEDLPEEEQATHLGYSAGLVNLGNTCYMNSTVQCLKSVPELKSALSNYALTGRSADVDQTSHMLTVATRELFGDLDRSVNAVSPTQFWMILRKKFPQFSQLQNGMHMQQDAEECWTQLLYTLSQSLKAPTSSEDSDAVKALFGVNLRSRVHCQESGEESSETESVYSLKCHISHEVNHLHEGLKHGLKGELEKTSPALGRTALYLKESLIDSLPRYLTVQFVRFFWKRETNQKAKILRKVDYPLELDIFDLCSEELRKKLEAPRQKLRDEEGKKLGLQPKSTSKDSDVKMTDAEASSKESGESSTVTQPEGGSSEKGTLHMTGIYDLVSVLTHKGRSADSGHYVAWVKQESGKWIQYDDSHPSLQREEDITKLSGGGVLVASVVMIIIMVAVIVRAKNARKIDWSGENIEEIVMLKHYSYARVKKMTNSFANALGKGGFGTVYKGKLPDGNQDLAVKILKESKGNGEEFINEVASMSRTSHVNIVSLLGFCYEGNKRAIIYEFMPNGSLDKFVSKHMLAKMDWEKLYNIALGISRGLEYLHNRCVSRIVHFDIKPQNILMDKDLCPKIADFCLAKLCKNKESIISMLDARGTAGYIAPEVFSKNFGVVSHKSDVYSYGMVVLEMIGTRNIGTVEHSGSNNSSMYFPDWIYKGFERGEIMKFFGDHITKEEEKIARKMVLVGLWCMQTNPTRRPAMIKVIEMLEGSLEALEVPPKHILCLTATRVPDTTEDSNNETSSFSYPSQFERGTLSGEDTLRISA